MKRATTLTLAGLLTPMGVKAHCPLCTIGAAGAAGAAAYFGVSAAPIGVFLGAFTAAIGLWISRAIKKQYVPYQKYVLIALSFVTTIIPLLPLLSQYRAVYLPVGTYGTTFAMNTFLAGSLLGLAIMIAGPVISSLVTKKQKKKIPYQGISVTFGLLLISAIILQVAL